MKSDQSSAASSGQFQTIKDVEAAAKGRMEKVISDFQHQMTTLRTGRASVHLLDGVTVEAYGSPMPISHLATLHAPEPTMITVQPYDASQIGPIEKAIRSADLGLNPSNDGKLIRVPVPALTEERRKEMVKHLHVMVEEHRVAVRNIRRDANDQFKKMLKDKLISEDEDRRGHDDVQKMTDAHITKLEDLAKIKEKEVMEI
ncbi:MAG: ribosome recycling factor [Bryobacteraceae bacterium]|nr:ribosome recycling factor [Bryobacteraceae bacterium]HAX41062.1 ribosome recycling factor [Bryobacterales bacterium]HRJ17604.1 ribosome recycling factor [Bryobacteraceae bacterium]